MIGNLISAGASIIGGVLGMKGQEATNAANAQLAREQMAFQREMATTQHQRQMEDLKAAGLNPALGIAHGSAGSAVPAGAQAVMKNVMEPLSSAMMAQASIDQMTAQARKTNAEAFITESLGYEQARATFERTVQQVGLTAQQANQIAMSTDLIVDQIKTEREKPAQIRQAVKLLSAQTSESIQRTLTEEQRTALVTEQTKLVLEQTALTAADVAAMETSGNFGRLVKEFGPAAEIVIDALRLLKGGRR